MRAKALPPVESPHREGLDRRLGERVSAGGAVILALENPEPLEIRGHLKDVSREGFRAIHHYAALCTGQQVQFQHASASGLAEVIWNRILGDRVESGFLVLETAKA